MVEGAQMLFQDCCRCLHLEKVRGLPFSLVQRCGACSPDLLLLYTLGKMAYTLVVQGLLHALERKPGHVTPAEAMPMSSKDESQPL